MAVGVREAFAIELATYARHRAAWLAGGGEGKYAVVRGERVHGPLETYDEAITVGYDLYGLGPFLVREIEAVEAVRRI